VSEWVDSVDLNDVTNDAEWMAEQARELEYNTACEIVCISRTMEENL